jgi:hypothetical protein
MQRQRQGYVHSWLLAVPTWKTEKTTAAAHRADKVIK